MLKEYLSAATATLLLGFAGSACAGTDNPTALNDLNPEASFEISSSEVQTMEEVEINVELVLDGSHVEMEDARLEIERGELMVGEYRMEPEGNGYAAHVMFFEEGEHHLHLMGRPNGHMATGEMGGIEVHVRRQHRIIGPYLVELELSPAPVYEDSSAHLHALVYELAADGGPGEPVGGLTVALEVHDPAGIETALAVAEEAQGEYEAAFTFGRAGTYEVHVEIDPGAEEAAGEFHVPVFVPSVDSDMDGGTGGDTGDDDGGMGGGGHGH